MNTKNLKSQLLHKTPDEEVVPSDQYLSTGSTLLNLACTGKRNCGFVKGKYHLIVGDSASGKTALSLTCLAEATISKQFNNYLLIHDDIEGGAMFNIKKLFGSKLAKRLKTEHSRSLEEMYYTLDTYLKAEKPFIYIVDSMDSLDTEEDEDKFQEQKKAHDKGKSTTGSYGVSKAKLNSVNLRRLVTQLRDSGSILIMICQTRDNLGFGFDKKTRSGGKALKFYATLEIWSSIREKIKKSVKGKERVIGIISKIDVKKNRITGQDRSIFVPIYYKLGFDDVGSLIDYLMTEGHWKGTKGNVKAVEFEFEGSVEKLAQYISEKDVRHRKLQRLASEVWQEIDELCSVNRRSRYE
jgi:RecA/RadA recombinase